jgi:hypothetical protein
MVRQAFQPDVRLGHRVPMVGLTYGERRPNDPSPNIYVTGDRSQRLTVDRLK